MIDNEFDEKCLQEKTTISKPSVNIIQDEKKDISLPEPIKKLGVYQATVKIIPEVKANLRVWIVKK